MRWPSLSATQFAQRMFSARAAGVHLAEDLKLKLALEGTALLEHGSPLSQANPA